MKKSTLSVSTARMRRLQPRQAEAVVPPAAQQMYRPVRCLQTRKVTAWIQFVGAGCIDWYHFYVGLKHGALRIISKANSLVLLGRDEDYEPPEPWARSNGDRGRPFSPRHAGRYFRIWLVHPNQHD